MQVQDDTSKQPTLEFPALTGIADEELSESRQADAEKSKEQADEAEERAEDATEGWLQAVNTAGEIISATWPSARPVWNPGAQERLAAALARCDEAYGWGGVGSLMSHPLLGLALAAFPLAIGTAKAVAAERAKAVVDVEAHEALKPSFAAGDPMAAAAGAQPQGAGAA